MLGTILSVCDPNLFQEAYDSGHLTQRGDLKVSLSDRRIRVASTPYLTQVVSDDGNGLGLVPGSKVTLSGHVSRGSYLYLRAESRGRDYLAFGAALFGHLDLEQGGTATLSVSLKDGRLVYDYRRPDGSHVSPLRTTLQAGPSDRVALPPLPAHYADSPQQGVETYIAAINADDGKTICELLLPSVRERFSAPLRPCWAQVGGHIGYGEESSTPLFQHASLRAMKDGRTAENEGVSFTAVPIEVRLRYRERAYASGFRDSSLHDVVWFQKTHDGWRVAKPSLTLYGAFSSSAPRDAIAVPAPAAALKQHQDDVKRERQDIQRLKEARLKAERQTRVRMGKGRLICGGSVASVNDPVGNVKEYIRPMANQRRAAYVLRRHIDITAVKVAVAGRTACVAMTFAHTPRFDRATLSLFFRRPNRTPGNATFVLERRPDGLHAGINDIAPFLTPVNAVVTLQRTTIFARFMLPSTMPYLRTKDLKYVAWGLLVDAAQRSRDQKPVLLDQQAVPPDAGRVRQSDGRVLRGS